DITSGVLASRIYEADELSLFLDIGTNGEVVLGNKEFLTACSASAGPAFEGGSVKCGMRATSGAIDTVRIARDDLEVTVSTIDGAPPVGLCGTGLVDALAQMFLAGLVDRNGALQVDRAPERFGDSDEDGRPEFVLVREGESGGGRDVTIDQSDVENIIRTKGAIYAAADSLVQSLGIAVGDIARIYIAGAFGNKLDVASCITIGLLPDVEPSRVEFIGNSAVAGAKLAMRDRKVLGKLKGIRDSITYQELMVDAGYMEKFTSACFLPHTDISRFPSVEAKLAQGNG
ncbi:MAG: ASKHA domain-containing protein, partial [Planctomycetota bacterium]